MLKPKLKFEYKVVYQVENKFRWVNREQHFETDTEDEELILSKVLKVIPETHRNLQIKQIRVWIPGG